MNYNKLEQINFEIKNYVIAEDERLRNYHKFIYFHIYKF